MPKLLNRDEAAIRELYKSLPLEERRRRWERWRSEHQDDIDSRAEFVPSTQDEYIEHLGGTTFEYMCTKEGNLMCLVRISVDGGDECGGKSVLVSCIDLLEWAARQGRTDV